MFMYLNSYQTIQTLINLTQNVVLSVKSDKTKRLHASIDMQQRYNYF